MDKELLKKYFNNSYSGEELKTILDWFEKYSHTKEGKLLLFETWEENEPGSTNPGADFDQILSRIHLQMNTADMDNLKEKSGNQYRFGRIISNMAAALLLPALIFGFYMRSKYNSVSDNLNSSGLALNEVFSSVDAITKVTLPDGSNVWLNHRSTLRYPAIFSKGSRSVELSGEGYFEVKHDEDNPFVVKAGGLDIIAVGTTFNILAYPDEPQVETSLISGIVRLELTGKESKPEDQLEMKPSDQFVYNKSDNRFHSHKITDDRYFSWKDGKLIFEKEPIDVVVKKLSRWFNVDIRVTDPELHELTFTGTFINESLYQVMELMSRVIPVNYNISERKETGSGIFSKREVTIFAK